MKQIGNSISFNLEQRALLSDAVVLPLYQMIQGDCSFAQQIIKLWKAGVSCVDYRMEEKMFSAVDRLCSGFHPECFFMFFGKVVMQSSQSPCCYFLRFGMI